MTVKKKKEEGGVGGKQRGRGPFSAMSLGLSCVFLFFGLCVIFSGPLQ